MPEVINNREELIAQRDQFLQLLDDPRTAKEAADRASDFTRVYLYDEGIVRRVMPPMPIRDDQLTRTVNDPRPMYVVDREVASPGAISIPYGKTPEGFQLGAERYAVGFARIASRRYYADVDELRTWIIDLRQLFADRAAKMVMYEEDRKFIRTSNSAMTGRDTTNPFSDNVQWESDPSPIDTESFVEFLKQMPRGLDGQAPATAVGLLNHITLLELSKIDYFEGGSVVEGIIKDGFSWTRFRGLDFLQTNRRGLIPDNTLFGFASPDFLGKHFSIQEPTMHVKREYWMLSYFLYENIGASIGNFAGVARRDYEWAGEDDERV